MISSFDMVGRKDEAQGENPMKRLLLTCAAATAIMLTACIDVDLASSAHSVDGARVTLTSGSSSSSAQADEGESETEDGEHAASKDAPRDDARLRS